MRSWALGVTRNVDVACVPHPITPLEVAPDARQRNLILFLGRLDPAKGVLDLLQALAELRPAVPDVRLLCAGEGDRSAVARYAERLGVGDVVKFTGWVGPSGKRALLEAATVLALPSYEETLPMSVLEAMAAGVPVVVSPVGGMPEIVADGVSGLFAAPGDVATLQRQLRKLLADRTLAARMGAAARQSIQLRCAPERALARLAAVYAELGLQALFDAPGPMRDPRSPHAAL
jgi:glycosyltransferase involved in cell wall biosynthesis